MIVIGADIWNMTITNDVGRCLSTSGGGLNEHIPVVIVIFEDDEADNRDREEVWRIPSG